MIRVANRIVKDSKIYLLIIAGEIFLLIVLISTEQWTLVRRANVLGIGRLIAILAVKTADKHRERSGPNKYILMSNRTRARVLV